ncbi:DUF2218 domain-containing protein [Amaricoccus solimangrovi]|nr:DUF2218 domain-containing protein [Amaricoccus solimangrovi]
MDDDPPRHRGEGAEGRRGRRPFDYGALRGIVLGMIAEEPRHGYELMRAIEERMGGGYSPSPGVIYPTLSWLEDMGYAEPVREAGRKRYAITPEGTAFLAASKPVPPAFRDAAGGHGDRRPPAPEVREAMGDLKHALRRRFAAGVPDPETIETVAAAIRAAARNVENTMTDATTRTVPETAEPAGAAIRELAEVRTAHAARYLGQLCKHFAHKIPAVDYAETSGTIPFAAGTARLAAGPEALRIELEAAPAEMERLRDVVVRHLVRFAFREELAFDWRPA